MMFLYNNLSKKNIEDALKIYNFYIVNSYSNFEEKKLSKESFKLLYKKTKLNNLPFIVGVENEEVIGIAFVNKFRDKSGYRFTFEHSIYVNPKYIKKGNGSKILKELVKQCKKNKNIKNLIAVIGGSDNLASINIHKRNGFKFIGTIVKAGFKKNKWIDSVYMQRRL